MPEPAVELEIRANLAEIKTQLAELTVMLRQVAGAGGAELAPGMARVSAQTQVATAGFGRLSEALRSHMMQARGTFRATAFFTRELGMLGIAATGAGAPLARLLAGFAMGPVAAAVAAVAAIAIGIKQLGKEAEEAKKKWDAFAKKLHEDAIQAAEDLYYWGKAEGLANLEKAHGRLALSSAKLAEAQDDMNKATGAEELGAAALRVKKYEEEVKKAREVVADAEKYMGAKAGIKGKEEAKRAGEKEASDRLRREQEFQAERLRLEREMADEEERIWSDFNATANKFPELRVQAEVVALQKIEALHEKTRDAVIKIDEEMYRESAAAAGAAHQAKIRALELGAAATEDPFVAAEKRYQAQLERARAMPAGPERTEFEKAAGVEKARAIGQAWVSVGNAISNVFSGIGAAIGGTVGKMAAAFGQLIQQAIQLAVALSATAGPLGWLNAAAAAAALIATIMSIPKFEAGTPYVPFTGLAMVHRGERIVPAAENDGGGWGRPAALVVNFGGVIDGPNIRRSLRKNRGELARALRELVDDGRGW